MFKSKWLHELKASRAKQKRIKTVSDILRKLLEHKPTIEPFKTAGLGIVDYKLPISEMTQFDVRFETENFTVRLTHLIKGSVYEVRRDESMIFSAADQTIQYNEEIGMNDVEVFDEEQFALFEHELYHVLGDAITR